MSIYKLPSDKGVGPAAAFGNVARHKPRFRHGRKAKRAPGIISMWTEIYANQMRTLQRAAVKREAAGAPLVKYRGLE